MSLEQPGPRGLLVAGIGLATALVIACSSAPSLRYKHYEDWHELMEHEMNPVLGAFTDELSRDPKDTDHAYIRDQSRRAAYYFSLFSDEGSHLYASDPDERAAAGKARAWLLEVAAAADRREQEALVRLMGERRQICTLCHDYPEG